MQGQGGGGATCGTTQSALTGVRVRRAPFESHLEVGPVVV